MHATTTPVSAAHPSARAPMRASLALLGMVLIWGLNFSIVKNVLSDVPPLAFNALRFPLAAAVLFAALRSRGPLPRPSGVDTWRLLLYGILGNVIYQFFFIFGLANSRAGTASVLLAGTPIATAMMSLALGHERVPRRVWVGAIAAFTGIALVVSAGTVTTGVSRDTVVGNLLLLGATISWAAYTVGSRGLVHRYGSVSATAWMLWTGTVGVIVLGLPDLLRLDFGALPVQHWLAILYAGVFGIGLAYLIWHYGVSQIGNTRTSIYSNLVPVVALFVAWLSLGEVPSAGQVAGAAVILGGVTLAQWR